MLFSAGKFNRGRETNRQRLLSTITGTSAMLVAIIGGLMLARFLGLESEQQGAERVLKDPQERLTVARQRLDEAAADLRDFDAHDFFDDRDVLNAITAGHTDLAHLRRERGTWDLLSDDELKPYLDGGVRQSEHLAHLHRPGQRDGTGIRATWPHPREGKRG